MKFILGKKIEMAQIFDDNGKVTPVTLVEAGPCFVTQVKTKEKEESESVQIGFETKKQNRVKKTDKGKEYKNIREFSGTEHVELDISKYKIGDEINVSIFEEGDKVKVSGMSKGKGFEGIIKRHGFHRKPHSHGTKHEERAMGSVGPAFPQRVIKARKMPGRSGFDRISIKNLKIIKIDAENNIIALKGAIPGRRGTLLELRV